MNFLEKDLEEIIYTADKAELGNKGLYLSGKLFRQLRIGNYGIADLVTVSRVPKFSIDNKSKGQLWITVYELKKEKIGVSAFLQALGYARGIERYLESRNFSFDVKINIELIGKSIDKNSTFCFLKTYLSQFSDGYTFPLECHTYSYGLNGLEFKETDYNVLKNEGF